MSEVGEGARLKALNQRMTHPERGTPSTALGSLVLVNSEEGSNCGAREDDDLRGPVMSHGNPGAHHWMTQLVVDNVDETKYARKVGILRLAYLGLGNMSQGPLDVPPRIMLTPHKQQTVY